MSDYEIEPTIEQLSAPYVLQLIRGISDLMDRIEELEAEVERLTSDADSMKACWHAACNELENDMSTSEFKAFIQALQEGKPDE